MCVCASLFASMHRGVLPCGDRVLLSPMDTGLTDHSDVFNVFPLDAQVGAPDGDGDSSPQGAEARDDLDEQIQCLRGGGWRGGCL